MEFIQEITLDLNANTTYTTVAAKQRDSARWLKIHLTKNNLSYNLDPSHSFMFRMRKPDGHGVINPAFVELNSTDLYIPIDITKDNYNNYVNYYKEVEDNVYETVPVSTFFSQIEEYEDGCYVQDANGRYIEATSGDAPPYYEFIGEPVGVTIYYLQNNINFAESTVNIQLTEQVLAVPGRGYADIVEYDGIGNVLSSVSFIVNIMASPDVAGNATSTDEFQKLADVVADADNIIGEAETWTRGTNKGINVAGPSFEKYDSENFGPSEFNQRNKEYLYIKSNDSYVQVDSTASFDPNQTYYGLDASIDHNAKLYAEQAATQWGYYNNLTVETIENYTGTVATVSIGRNTAGMATQYVFGLPRGIQGETGATGPTGPATCVASDIEPIDPAVEVWIDTTGETKPFIGTANQIYYDQQATYDTHTVGEFLQGIGDLTEQAEAAKTAAIAAQEAATNASNSASTAISNVASVSDGLTTERQERTNADITLNSSIQGKITMPTDVDLNNGIYTLAYTISSQGSERIKDLHWGHDSYNNLTNRPYINDAILTGDSNLNLITNTNKAVQSSHLDDNIIASLNKADSAIQIVQLNNELLIPTDYKGPYIIDTDVTASNWDEVKDSLYYYDTTSNNYGHITEDSSYSSNMVYYTHDSTYDNQKFVDLGTVLKEDNIVKDNLLDNPWFQVNQHNFDSQTVNSASVGSYLCDRWKIMMCQDQTRNISLDSNTGLLHISAGEGADALKDFAIGQVFDEDFSKSLIGKTVCLSVGYVEDNQIKYGSGFGLCTAQGTPFIQLNENLDWYVRLVKVEETNRLAFQITSAQNITGKQITPKEIYIKNTKLEIGKFSTLSQDIAPVLASELAKCRKYFCKIVGQPYSESEVPTVIGFGILGATKQLDWSLSLPLSMTVPSAVTYIYASTDLIIRRGITATSSAGTLPSSAIASSTKFNGINGVYFQTAASGTLATYSPYYVLLPNAAASNTGLPFVAISAEL